MQGDEYAVLVVSTETALLADFWRVAEDDSLALNAHEVLGVKMLYLIHVCAQARIALCLAFGDEEIAVLVLCDNGRGNSVLDVLLDETTHALLLVAWREYAIKTLEQVKIQFFHNSIVFKSKLVVLGRQEEEGPPALVLGYNNKSMLFSVLGFCFVGTLLGAIVFTGDIRIALAVIIVRIPLAAFGAFGVFSAVKP